MSKQYRTCEKCGANLDAGEKCDCMRQLSKEEIIIKVLTNFAERLSGLCELYGEINHYVIKEEYNEMVEDIKKYFKELKQ